MPWTVKAQETLTVYDGTNSTLTTDSQVPMYGNYFDDYTKSECIIPASQLNTMNGSTISAITFYPSSVATTNSTWANTSQTVFLKGFLNRAFRHGSDVSVFSMFQKVQSSVAREKGVFTLPFSFLRSFCLNASLSLQSSLSDSERSHCNT